MKQRILEAAASEIEVHGTTFRMEDLAKRLNISKRTLYEHFSSKNEIIEEIVINLIDDFHSAHTNIIHDKSLNFEEKLNAYFSYQSALFASLNGEHHRELYNRMPHLLEFAMARCEEDWYDFKKWLISAQKRREIRADVDLDTMILLLRGLVNIILYDKTRNPEEVHENMPKAITMLLHGILN